MADTYYSQGSDNWSTYANWNTEVGGGGSSPANLAAMDQDDIVIQAGHTITLDEDMSALTGLASLTIQGHATDPGMLISEFGGDGTYYLKMVGDIVGTSGAARGRILGNSDGVWGNTGALPNGRKFIIDLQGTAQIECEYLDVRFYCTQPTNEFVHCYGTKFDFDAETDCDPATNVLTLNTTAPAEGTDVTLVAAAGATLPTGLYENMLYYVRDNSGNDCKLAVTNSDDTIVDITADGSGTIYLLTEQASSTTDLNVLEDVTSDAPWTATAGHDFVVLVDALAPENYDIQRMTIGTIVDADTITLDANVDSTQYAGTILYLSSRNISIRYYGITAQGIFNYPSNATHGGVFQCEIRNAQSQTSFYGYGIYYGSGHTISGTVSGCSYGIFYGSGYTISGIVSGCTYGIFYGSGYTISGTVSGCSYGISDGSGHAISGIVSGCSNGIYFGSGYTISGIVSGCMTGIYFGSGHAISGIVSGCSNGIYSGSGYTISGIVSGCSYGIYFGSWHAISGTVSGCSYGIYSGSGYTISGIVSGCTYGIYSGSGGTISGTVSGNLYDFRFPVGDITIFPGATVTYTNLYGRGSMTGEYGKIAVEEFEGTPNTYKIIDQYGDIIKTACDGTGDAPSIDPDGGNGYCYEASNIQDIFGVAGKLVIFKRACNRIWLTAGSYTVTYKIQTTYSGIAEGGLTLRCWYIGVAGAIIETTDDSAIAQASDDTDWTQTLAVSFTSTADGWADFQIELTEYQENDEVYVWPTPIIT